MLSLRPPCFPKENANPLVSRGLTLPCFPKENANPLVSRGLALPLFLSTKKVPFPAIKTKKGTNIIRVTTLILQYHYSTLHTSICYPYNGGDRRGLTAQHIPTLLSARFLERIS